MKLRYKVLNGLLIFSGVAILSLALVLSHTSACGPTPAISDETELMKAIVYRCYGSPDVLVGGKARLGYLHRGNDICGFESDLSEG